MDAPRLKISERMRAIMAYPKLAGPVPRLLILESNYWLDIACMNAARALGWDFERVPVLMAGKMPRDMVAQFLEALVAFRPDFVLTVNLSGMDSYGLFASLFEDLRVPYVTWFVDDPRTILMGRDTYGSGYAIALTWEKAYIEYLTGSGFGEVHVMPLAVDPTVFNAEPGETWDLPPTFVANSMAEFAERESAWVQERPELAQALQEAFDAGRVTRDRFGRGLQTILDPALWESLDAEEQRHAEMVCFIEGTRRLRFDFVKALEPEGIAVRGDEAWKELVADWGPYVNYTEDMPQYYRRCPVNLNSTSIQMATTVNQRAFDCPAAGGFLLTDAQAALEDLFDVDSETARYRDHAECLELLRHYRVHPEERRAITKRARRRILNEHTYEHRLKHIATLVRNRFATS